MGCGFDRPRDADRGYFRIATAKRPRIASTASGSWPVIFCHSRAKMLTGIVNVRYGLQVRHRGCTNGMRRSSPGKRYRLSCNDPQVRMLRRRRQLGLAAPVPLSRFVGKCRPQLTRLRSWLPPRRFYLLLPSATLDMPAFLRRRRHSLIS